jgi:O-antigen chain-terminating methyltransferase
MPADPLNEESIDKIMEQIRNELRTAAAESAVDERRDSVGGAIKRVQLDSTHASGATAATGLSGDVAVSPAIQPIAPPRRRFEQKSDYHLGDFLAYDDEEFLRNAYIGILRRELDDPGRELFLEKLRSGRLSKVELLARLRYSGEGRSRKVPIRGHLAARGLAKASMRLPVVGYLIALLIYLFRLPAIAASLTRLDTELRAGLSAKADTTMFWEVINQKVDKGPFWEVINQKVDKGPFWEVINQKVDKGPFWDIVNQKVDKNHFDVERERATKEFWDALNGKLDKHAYVNGYAQLTEALVDIRSTQRELSQAHQQQKVGLIDQQRRLALLLEEARKRMPEPFSKEQIGVMSAVADHWLDAYYLSFEDRFRGTREDIKQRASVYLPILRAASAGTADRPIVDLGCGRGELLELLADSGLVARGVDLNQILVEQCKADGLNVTEADAISYLRGLPASSVGAVTGLHIIEHIPFDQLVQLLDEARRVLKPGGVVAVETPNPENLLVGACNFYYDPTHLNPLPPPVTQFLLEARGFVGVEIKRLTENRAMEVVPEVTDEPGHEHLNRVIGFINTHFGAAPDYAVLGFKA